MKNQLFFIYVMMLGMLSMFCFTGTVKGQNPIPNGNFENWNVGIYSIPANYIESSDPSNFFDGLPFNVVQVDTGTYTGCAYALQLTTVVADQNIAFGYLLNTNPNNGNPTTWTGGFPYSQTPTGIRGWYKSNVQPGDTALIFVVFRSEGSAIGLGEVKLTGSHSSWTLFTAPLTVLGTPDSVIIGATSSDVFGNIGIAGSTITLDSISFTGVSSQPALLDGNFANWQTDTLTTPISWYVNTGNNGETSVSRTTDAYNGQYAAELQTLLGNNNNSPAAQPASLSTGSYNNCENSLCQEIVGYPFTNQVDTLVFWYKYAPANGTNDSANVNFCFSVNDSLIGCYGANLGASANYQEVELPFNLSGIPDTVTVDFQSSIYQDSTVNYVGSDLKVDLVYFTSQPLVTGIMKSVANNKIDIYPNPFKTTATLEVDPQADLQGMELRMTDVLGRSIKTTAVTDHIMTIGKANLASGVYLYEVINNNGILKTGKIIIE